jgi:hypothetical protein
MKKRFVISLLFGLFVFSSFSCRNATPTPKTATPEHLRMWQISWLDQSGCRPPCWQNITPGLTTRNEALAILETMPSVEITYYKEDGLTWYFGTKSEGGNITASAEGIVSSIWLGSTNKDLQIQKVVDFYEFPKYVQPFDCRDGMCDTALIYPDLGMLLGVFVTNENESNAAPKIVILPETIVYRVHFIKPGIEDTLNFLRSENSLLTIDMEWKGYGEYP